MKVNNTLFSIILGDITTDNSSLIINWTTPLLNGGNNIHKKIHNIGGSTLYKECLAILNSREQINGIGKQALQIGEVAITKGGMLNIQRILHCVVPDFRTIEKIDSLKSLMLQGFNNIKNILLSYYIPNDYSTIPIRKIATYPIPPELFGMSEHSIAVSTELLINQLLNYINNYNPIVPVREVKIYCSTKEEHQLFIKELKAQTSIWYKILNKFI